jgi:hypothetical protein
MSPQIFNLKMVVSSRPQNICRGAMLRAPTTSIKKISLLPSNPFALGKDFSRNPSRPPWYKGLRDENNKQAAVGFFFLFATFSFFKIHS